ncbi:hypothetical protein G0Q06_11850 [Puniceicoccales bacterium CK1056]|uniref:Uncharacterized protein n=1 Tax=Oceanipulchritudo coccoides TaxID=2706888 RepID=A0A6B2M2H2_9BACT|nr:hypothetical protein [Oceanipulchritudo coccoides]NDV63148.1 hypothetical protein [Oceanipulchritudo coccoides]
MLQFLKETGEYLYSHSLVTFTIGLAFLITSLILIIGKWIWINDAAIKAKKKALREIEERSLFKARQLIVYGDRMRSTKVLHEKMQKEIREYTYNLDQQTTRLYGKIQELIKLRSQNLIDADKFCFILSEYIKINMDVVSLEDALKQIKSLQEDNFIDAAGYNQISDIIVKKYYSTEIGIKGRVMSLINKGKKKI